MNRERFARVVDGRFRVVQLLGEGGLGKVYLVEDLLKNNERLALKLLSRERMASRDVEELKEEFRAMAGLRHPGIARAYDFGTDAETGRHYLTREYIEGVSLLEASHQLPVESLPELFVQLCGALSYMHSRDVFHLDLKPQNVLVENCPVRTARMAPRAKLLDFGLGTKEKSPATLTGTVHYAPPEAFLGGPLDGRSDLYSLGVILYQVLTGRLPFDDGKPIAVINAHLRRQPEPPRALEPKIPRSMEAVILRLLEKDPARRFTDAREVRDAILDAAERPGAPPPVRPAAEPLAGGSFVGRDKELESLLAALGALKEGNRSRPGAVLVCGPAGIGKTRLADEFRRQAQLEEIPFFYSVCHPSGGVPCGPFLDLLRQVQARGFDPDESPAPGRLAATVTRSLLEERAGEPRILHLEDLHRADELTLDVFERLLRRSDRTSLLLTATLREEEVDDRVAARLKKFRRDPRLLIIELPVLNSEEMVRLLRSMLGTTQDFRKLANVVRRATDGNPLFVEQLMKNLHDEGTLKMVSGRWRFDLDRIGERLPGSVADLVGKRLGRLEADDRKVLECLSAFDRPVGPESAAAIAGIPEEEARRRLDGLTRRGLLRLDLSRSGRPRFRIRHRPVRDVAYAGLAGRTRATHRRIGEFLEGAGGGDDRVEEIGWHFVQAGDRDRGLKYSLEAAERADRNRANDRAAAHLDAALRMLGRRDRALRARILFRDGAVRKRIGDHAAAIRSFTKARSIWADQQAAEDEVRALEQIAWCHGAGGGYDKALKIARQALAIAERRDLREGIAKSLNTIGMILSRTGHGDTGLDYYRRALALWEELGEPLRAAGTLNNMGLVCLFRGHPDESLGYLQKSLALRKEAGEVGLAAQSLNNIGLALQAMGRHEEALKSFEDCHAAAARVEALTDQAASMTNRAETEALLGRYDAALDSFERAMALTEEMHNPHLVPHCLGSMAGVHRRMGDHAAAASTGTRGLEEARRRHDAVQEGFALAGLARDRYHLGELGEAKKLLDAAEAIASKRGHHRILAHILETRHRIGADRSDRRELRDVAKAAETLAADTHLREDRLLAVTARADAFLASGKPEEAAAVLTEAEDLARALGRRETEIEVLARLARAAHDAGDADRAATRWNEAATAVRALAGGIADRPMRERYLAAPARRDILDRAAGKTPAPVIGVIEGGAEPLPGRALLALHDITRAITSILSLDELLERVMDLAIELVGAERGILFLRDDTTGEMRIRVARQTDKETLADASEYSTRVLQESAAGHSILAVDAGSDDRFRRFQSVSLYHIRSLMCVPLKHQDKILGTVYLDTRHARKAFTDADLRFLEIFAGQAAIAIENARLVSSLEDENQYLKQVVEDRTRYADIIGKSQAMREVYDLLDRLRETSLPVLISGESGTGKEMVARAIHFHGTRKEGRFLSENCAALPESLLESELFGHVRGAFTGADRNKDGLFLAADGGTLFLDEIADMSRAMQSKLLRVIQEGEIRAVGSDTIRKVDVRIVSATNQPPDQLVAEGKLREDLYYRLSVVTVDLPALRERKEDIPLLVQHFLDRIAATNNRAKYQVSREAMDLLLRYDWPGNVRELENSLSRLALFTDDRITLRTLEQDRQTYERLTGLPEAPAGTETLDQVEKRHILRAVDLAGGDRNKAANMLGISRATIFRKLKQYRME